MKDHGGWTFGTVPAVRPTFTVDKAQIIEPLRSEVLVNSVDASVVESLERHVVGREYRLRRSAADTVDHRA